MCAGVTPIFVAMWLRDGFVVILRRGGSLSKLGLPDKLGSVH